MTTYQPGIPTGIVPLDEDYLNLQGNFKVLDTVYATDHVALTDSSSKAGYHTVVHLVNTVADPAPIGGTGEIYTKQLNDGYATRSTLFYQPGTASIVQMTSNFTPIANPTSAASFLPGGIVMNCGKATAQMWDGTLKILFPKTFATALISVVFSPFQTDLLGRGFSSYVYKADTTGFNPIVFSTSSGGSTTYSTTDIYFIAYGL